jgi:Cu/Ag efflux protein CusF
MSPSGSPLRFNSASAGRNDVDRTHQFALAGLLAIVVASPGPALAQATMDHAKTSDVTLAQATVPTATDGEVRKVDKHAGKITLKHGEIKNLDMPGMTMVFAVSDKSMLDNLRPGDKVKFKAINDSGRLMLTEIQLVK